MSLQTPLKHVRGLGSAKEGVQHWWGQRMTALALVPLTLWFVYNLVRLGHADHTVVAEWVGNPPNAILLVLLAIAMFHHAAAGIQVVIEDYVHRERHKMVLLLVVKAICILLGSASIFAILKLAFTATVKN